MELKDFSMKELDQEMRRRKPVPRRGVHTASIIQACEDYINNINGGNGGEPDPGLEHYIFEAAMKGVYSEDVFDWVNAMIE